MTFVQIHPFFSTKCVVSGPVLCHVGPDFDRILAPLLTQAAGEHDEDISVHATTWSDITHWSVQMLSALFTHAGD